MSLSARAAFVLSNPRAIIAAIARRSAGFATRRYEVFLGWLLRRPAAQGAVWHALCADTEWTPQPNLTVGAEILRRVRFLWALAWIAAAVALTIYSPAILPLRVVPPLLAAFAPYLGPMPVRLALTWLGAFVSFGLAIAIDSGQSASDGSFAAIFVAAPGGAVLILLAAFLLSPLFKKGA